MPETLKEAGTSVSFVSAQGEGIAEKTSVAERSAVQVIHDAIGVAEDWQDLEAACDHIQAAYADGQLTQSEAEGLGQVAGARSREIPERVEKRGQRDAATRTHRITR